MNTLDQEKLFYERFWALHRDPQLVEIFKTYGIAAFRRSSVLEGFEEFIQQTGFKGHTCVEIGSLKGLTAIVLSRYFSRVISIDILDDPLKWEIASSLGISNITFLNVIDNEEKKRIIEGLEFDAAYSDGDHAHDAMSDFNLVRRCKRVLFHEFWDAQPNVVKLVGSLDSGTVTSKGKFALWTS
jgi:hypothetical protein